MGFFKYTYILLMVPEALRIFLTLYNLSPYIVFTLTWP